MLLDAPVLPWRTAMLAAWQAHRAAIGAVSAEYPQTPPRSIAGHPAQKMRTHRISPLSYEFTVRFEDQHAWLLHADPLHPTCCAGCVAVLGAVAISGATRRSYFCRLSHSISSLIGSINIMIFSDISQQKRSRMPKRHPAQRTLGDYLIKRSSLMRL